MVNGNKVGKDDVHQSQVQFIGDALFSQCVKLVKIVNLLRVINVLTLFYDSNNFTESPISKIIY